MGIDVKCNAGAVLGLEIFPAGESKKLDHTAPKQYSRKSCITLFFPRSDRVAP